MVNGSELASVTSRVIKLTEEGTSSWKEIVSLTATGKSLMFNWKARVTSVPTPSLKLTVTSGRAPSSIPPLKPGSEMKV